MGIFDKRENYKPFEYPEVMEFVNAMHKSFWVHSEVEFTADIQDFKSNLSTVEQEAVKRFSCWRRLSKTRSIGKNLLGRSLRPFSKT